MKYLFQLGREPHISVSEIKAVFACDHVSYDIDTEDSRYLTIETTQALDPDALIHMLGGTIKIAEYIGTAENPVDKIAAYLTEARPEGKIEFSISGNEARRLGLHIKKTLIAEGRSARYIEANNTATIIHNRLVEKKSDITIVGSDIFVTRAVQPIEEWSERDYGRPGRDSTSGMLPPKLARIMINLSGAHTNDVILDPFCGSGTILTEALLMGFTHVIGSDHSPTAIEDSKKNIAWTRTHTTTPARIARQSVAGGLQHNNTSTLLLSDVRKLNSPLGSASVNAIITEPYLGKPLRGSEPEHFVREQVGELKKLYAESFASFHTLLKPKGVVIFITPRFKRGNDWITIDCQEAIKKTGFDILPFSEEHPHLLYFRPTQHLGREIWRFKRI